MTINAIIECDLDDGTWQEKVFLTFSLTSGSDTRNLSEAKILHRKFKYDENQTHKNKQKQQPCC